MNKIHSKKKNKRSTIMEKIEQLLKMIYIKKYFL